MQARLCQGKAGVIRPPAVPAGQRRAAVAGQPPIRGLESDPAIVYEAATFHGFLCPVRPACHSAEGTGSKTRSGPLLMTTVLIVVHLMIVIALVAVVLVQRSEGGALGIGGGGGGGFFTSRGTANLLTRTTAVLAALFFVTSLALTLLAHHEAKPTSILNNLNGGAGQAIPNNSQGDGKGILGTLQGISPSAQQSQPAAPAEGAAPAPAPQPTGPQVPNSQ